MTDQKENRQVKCVLVIPAHNEESSLLDCLEAIADAELPTGVVWDDWILADGGSKDRTVELWQSWSATHHDFALRVQRSVNRRGKAVELEEVRRSLRRRNDPDLVMVVCDADSRVTSRALLELLTPFVSDQELGVAWGLAVPHGQRAWRRGSWFQASLVAALARNAGGESIRAEGRLFAIRVWWSWSDPTQMNHPECERTDHNRYGREAHVEQKTYARTSHHQNC
ncbi:glycosyltransferase [Ferrimicrobium sp.]|uniref:glycosyltransferase n=1 Tax=Ferrimicrobium sp. TaxID=2926050 RepID=UPI00260A2408|nr:glycosyltransferase [Ferrimicrobium sp.]